MNKQLELDKRKEAFNARTTQYLGLGFDRFAAAEFVAVSGGQLTGPALDIGTGKGLMAMALARKGLDVLSIDLNADEQILADLLAVEAGLKNHIRFLCSDASTLPFPDEHFGCIAMMDVLHHLDDPIPVLEEAIRVLKPNGTIILADFSVEGFELIKRVHGKDGHEHPVSGFTLASAETFLIQKGFAAVTHRSGYYHEITVLMKNGGYQS